MVTPKFTEGFSMTRRTLFSAVAALLVAGLAVGSAQAQGTTDGKPGGRRGHEGFMQKKLGLTDEQAKQVREVMVQQGEARKKNGQAVRDANTELRRLVLNGADEGTVRAKQTDVTNLMAESVRLRVEGLKQISPILTPEQRQKLAEMKMGDHHGRRGKHPRPQANQG
jgi:Spy/CpxP family protein refolding chaperone